MYSNKDKDPSSFNQRNKTPLKFPLLVKSFDEAPSDRLVSIFKIGDYPESLKKVNP